jgi:hypothetical protein
MPIPPKKPSQPRLPKSNPPAPAPKDTSTAAEGPFTTGYEFTPTEIVTDTKLADQINAMIVNYPLLAQAMLNSGAGDPNALARFSNNQFQLRNATTGLWHSIWISGAVGAEEIIIGQGGT